MYPHCLHYLIGAICAARPNTIHLSDVYTQSLDIWWFKILTLKPCGFAIGGKLKDMAFRHTHLQRPLGFVIKLVMFATTLQNSDFVVGSLVCSPQHHEAPAIPSLFVVSH